MVSKYVKIIAVSIAVLGVIIPAFYFSFYQGPQKDIEIDIWYTYEGIQIIADAIEQYELEHPDININLIEQPSSGWLDKFISIAQTGDAPDIFLGKGAWFGELVELEYIRSLTNFLSPTDEAKYLPSAINSLSYMNELWGLPLWYDSILLFYNKDVFDQNSQPYPQENWTDIEFVEAAVNMTDRSVNQEYGLVWGTLSPYMWPAFQSGFGHGPLYQNNSIIVNDTASRNAMEFIYNLKYVERCVSYDDTSHSATQAFITNKGAMLIYGGWYIPSLNEIGTNYGVQILPIISSTDKRISPMVEIKGWGMSKDTLHPDICYDILLFLTSDEVQKELVSIEYKVPTLIETIYSPTVQNEPLILTQIKQIENSQYYPMDPIYNFYSDYIRAALQFILLNHENIQSSLDDAQAGIDANR
ncbi:MAG: extracellular solute-binding protein [Candidatus Heimdallarchaeota archaeon]|nr:extracellular solute-binding protein [Candidatus Heimdallarchaeota archaeon]